MFEMIGFRDRERIHIRTQGNAFGAVSVFQDPDNARSADSGVNFNTPLSQVLGDFLRRFKFLVA